ncbi:SDR family NAD(P)-dependent oxidoreductase [Mycolicibacter sinensis]|uniref:Short-chain dehydrogenase n=1 Tax=Mycolicibacter sinensis (strain JDM601) TaxID=875328 RepID=A0A1A2E1E0_MYCSD|nr:SDR family NAD(P)-dependent oxidoreductase [Mycolicibacter sinensis]OBF99342.1 short-chain dehydrogenase [Mycolicibacter sinensis]OBG02526.1 short-chain dehydrogenase [Mycolicibacter sinensis]
MRGAKRLAGKAVLITGGAQGIGGQVARQLVGHGTRVAIVDRDGAAAQRLAAELGPRATAIEADVTSAEAMVAACDAAAEQFGGLDVVVANAGIAGPAATVAAEWRRVIDVNLVGVFHTAAAALPYLRQRRGYLLAVASIGAVIPGPTVSAYMAAKAGVESLTRSLRIELGGTGVGVGVGYFGLVDTGLAQQMLTGSGVGAMLSGLPVLSRAIPAANAATAIITGIARRSRRVYAPGWVAPVLDLRVPLMVIDRLLAVWPSMRRTVRDADEAEVRA